MVQISKITPTLKIVSAEYPDLAACSITAFTFKILVPPIEGQKEQDQSFQDIAGPECAL